MNLKVSTLQKEGIYQGSKYLKIQVLLDAKELSCLFQSLPQFFLFPLTRISLGEEIDQEAFLKAYETWIAQLKRGEVLSEADLREFLAAVMTSHLDALWKQQIPKGRYLIKMSHPCIHVQAHFFTYSSVDRVFRSMTMSSYRIFWGLEFSFPQIYQDPKSMQLKQVASETLNAKLFRELRYWVRENTLPTPFVVEKRKVNVPIRIGKNCFSWIHCHPQLKEQQIEVYAN